MALSYELISQFAKLAASDKKTTSEATVYGTIKVDAYGNKYVKLDGSDQLTPLADENRPTADTTIADAKVDERVSVLIKDHTATVTGNMSSPAARTEDVETIATDVAEFEVVTAHRITTDDIIATNGMIDNLVAITGKYTELDAVTAEIGSLKADLIEGEKLKVDEIDALIAKIEHIESECGKFTDISTEDFDAINAEITNLKGYTADFTYISAVKADVRDLDVGKADIDLANINDAAIKHLGATFANINFANISVAAIRKIFSDSGLIRDLVVGDQTITGELVGVTVTGDLIKANTLMADKLVVRGSDGNYYKLSTDFTMLAGVEPVEEDSIHGSTIVAKSITAEKVRVKDLVAFGATIGGFHITDRSLYSGVKDSVKNTTRGIYLDNSGQMSLGDGNQFLRYYIVEEASASIVDDVLVVTELSSNPFDVSISNGTLHVADHSGVYADIVGQTLNVENDSSKLEISVDSVMLSRRAKDINSVLDDVDDEIADYHSFISKFSKYIRFMEDENGNPSDTAMTIGSGDSVITLEIDNVKGLIFKKNGNEFGSWDGTNFHTGNIKIDVEERAQFGNFAFVPRSDGSLSFLKVGG